MITGHTFSIPRNLSQSAELRRAPPPSFILQSEPELRAILGSIDEYLRGNVSEDRWENLDNIHYEIVSWDDGSQLHAKSRPAGPADSIESWISPHSDVPRWDVTEPSPNWRSPF